VPDELMLRRDNVLLFLSKSVLAQALLSLPWPRQERGADSMPIQQLRNSHLKTSVIVHIEELLDEYHRKSIESIMKRMEGVTHAHFNETQHHLMIVGYDPKRTDADTILMRVRRQHLHAQVI
jgi:hypothetical protein